MTDLHFNYFDDYDEGYDDTGLMCKRCGKDYLEWKETAQGWRLFEANGEMHECPRRNHFEDESDD